MSKEWWEDLPDAPEQASGGNEWWSSIPDAPKESLAEKIKDPSRRQRIVEEGAREFARQSLASNKSGKGGFERFVRGFNENVGAQLVGAGTAAFGVGDAALRAKFKSDVPWMTDDDATLAMRSFRDEVFKIKPAAAITGAVAGGVASGGAVVKGAQAAAKAIPAIAPAIASLAVSGEKGKRLADVAKLAGGGVAGTAATTLVSEERLPDAGEVALGAVVGPALAAVGGAGKSVIDFFSKKIAPDSAAARALAKASDIDIEKRVAEYKRKTGDQPMLAQILTPNEQQRVADIVTGSPTAQDALDAGIETAERDFRKGIRTDAASLGRGASERAIESARDKAIKVVLDPIRDSAVRLSQDEIDLIADSAIFRSAPAAIQREIMDGSPRVGTLEKLRVNADDTFGEDSPKAQIEAIVSSQYPQYGQAIRGFARTSAMAAGAKEGAAGVSRNMTDDEFAALARMYTSEASSEASKQGVKLGALDRVAGTAASSPDVLARQMTMGNLKERLSIVLDPRLVEGASESMGARLKGVESVRNVTGRRAVSEATREAAETGDVVMSTIGSTTGAGGAAVSGVVNRFLKHGKLPDKVRERVAAMVLDPDKAADAIGLMRKAGYSLQNIRDLYMKLAIAGGGIAAQETPVAREEVR